MLSRPAGNERRRDRGKQRLRADHHHHPARGAGRRDCSCSRGGHTLSQGPNTQRPGRTQLWGEGSCLGNIPPVYRLVLSEPSPCSPSLPEPQLSGTFKQCPGICISPQPSLPSSRGRPGLSLSSGFPRPEAWLAAWHRSFRHVELCHESGCRRRVLTLSPSFHPYFFRLSSRSLPGFVQSPEP